MKVLTIMELLKEIQKILKAFEDRLFTAKMLAKTRENFLIIR